MALVSKYNPAWPTWFLQIRGLIAEKLGSYCLVIEHFGSTAVPGMTAKPIIDLDVVIEPDRFDEVKRLLGELGYSHLGDLGIPEREAFTLGNAEIAQPLPPDHLSPLASLLSRRRRRRALPPHHLYVCPRESAELKRHRAFRDFLRTHPDWVARLSELKRSLCELHGDDREAYMEGKSAMVQEITSLALPDAMNRDQHNEPRG